MHLLQNPLILYYIWLIVILSRDRIVIAIVVAYNGFHFLKPNLLDLCRNLGPTLERETKHTNAIPVHILFLSTPGILGTGTFQREIGDRSGISQPSMCRIIPAVLDAIISPSPDYIQFPYIIAQQAEVKRKLFIPEGPQLDISKSCSLSLWRLARTNLSACLPSADALKQCLHTCSNYKRCQCQWWTKYDNE